MAHTELSRTPSGAGNRKTYTISFWVKRSELSTQNILFQVNGGTNNTNYMEMSFNGSNQLLLGGYTSNFLTTNRKFRDTSAWYHIVWRVDTTQSTADDRVRLYVNGVQETSFSTRNNPGQNDDTGANMAAATKIGQTLDGLLAQYIMADGQSYAPTTFGSTDSNGVWVPNASPSVTYGTNGFKLDFKLSGTSADASGFGADSSGQTNHFATTNIATNPNTKDSPTNVFATWNPLTAFRTASFNGTAGGSITDAGLKAVGGGGAVSIGFASTIAVNSGKWYAEFKAAATDYTQFGVGDVGTWTETYGIGGASKAQIYGANVIGWDRTIYYINSTSSTSGGTTFSDGDICQIAIDADTRKVWFGVNGTYNSSGNPAGGSNEIGTVTGTGPLVFLCRPESTNVLANFGIPSFTIASGNADANGYGNFEYAVPSGFYALCTKNLAQYG